MGAGAEGGVVVRAEVGEVGLEGEEVVEGMVEGVGKGKVVARGEVGEAGTEGEEVVEVVEVRGEVEEGMLEEVGEGGSEVWKGKEGAEGDIKVDKEVEAVVDIEVDREAAADIEVDREAAADIEVDREAADIEVEAAIVQMPGLEIFSPEACDSEQP